MREIKFRQAIYVNGKFKEFHYWGFLTSGHFAGPETNSATIEGAQKNSEMFTGLLDKNGKEVFEGDRLKLDSHYTPWVVCWFDGGFHVYNENNSETKYPFTQSMAEMREIIGNIHDKAGAEG